MLGYMHCTHLHHCALQNILLNTLGEVKLGDFGIAKELGGKTLEVTQTEPYNHPYILEVEDIAYLSRCTEVVKQCTSAL
jgi:serine/threonine protein kinase